ncbi:MAG: thiamine pyrophosphate-binding protein [Burkholderiales bacterium]
MPPTPAPTSWPDAVMNVFHTQKIRQVAYVPDTGLKRLIEMVRADKDMQAVPLTTEEEGVAMAVGACLGGERAVLLVQSSGAGNCINMLGMITECRVPLLMLVTMRGTWAEFNPWQIPMAEATAPVLAAIGCVVKKVDNVEQVGPTVSAACQLAFNTNRPVAVLMDQRVVGVKEFK